MKKEKTMESPIENETQETEASSEPYKWVANYTFSDEDINKHMDKFVEFYQKHKHEQDPVTFDQLTPCQIFTLFKTMVTTDIDVFDKFPGSLRPDYIKVNQ